jgi:hypothetical protein
MKKLDKAEFARAQRLEEERLGRKLTLAENREVPRKTLPPGVDIKGTACLFVGQVQAQREALLHRSSGPSSRRLAR